MPLQALEFCNPRTFVEVGDAHDHILQHIRDFHLISAAACPVLTIIG